MIDTLQQVDGWSHLEAAKSKGCMKSINDISKAVNTWLADGMHREEHTWLVSTFGHNNSCHLAHFTVTMTGGVLNECWGCGTFYGGAGEQESS